MSSSFVLQLPYRWIIFGLDGHIDGDINIRQLTEFTVYWSGKIDRNYKIILVIHQPFWLIGPHTHLENWLETNRPNLYILLSQIIEHVGVILSGDLHFYHRQKLRLKFNKKQYNIPVVVSGGGGSFTHLSHLYDLGNGCTYPTIQQSRNILSWKTFFSKMLTPDIISLFLFPISIPVWTFLYGMARFVPRWSHNVIRDAVAVIIRERRYKNFVRLVFEPTNGVNCIGNIVLVAVGIDNPGSENSQHSIIERVTL